MRIVGGKFKGRALVTPDGQNTRPTSDRAREAIFNILAHAEWAPNLEGARVMDVFAGSGALGFEALSRGAERAIFVEQDPAALRALRDNIAALRAQPACDVRAGSALALGPLAKGQSAPDLLLLDPPYDSGAGAVALDKLRRLGWIAPGAWISVETSRGERLDVKGFELDATRDSGRARLHLLRLAE